MSDAQARARMWNNLRRAYQATHVDDDALGPVNEDQSVVIQFIRIHTVPSQHVVDDFDRHCQFSGTKFISPEAKTFEHEVHRFHRLRRIQRQRLADQLKLAIYGDPESERFKTEGHNDEVEALCYDSVTGKYLIRRGIGTHHLVPGKLYARIRPKELGHNWPLPESERHLDCIERTKKFYTGMLCQIPKWRTPFLELSAPEPTQSVEDWQSAALQLHQMHRWIVTDAAARNPFRRRPS